MKVCPICQSNMTFKELTKHDYENGVVDIATSIRCFNCRQLLYAEVRAMRDGEFINDC